MDTAHNCLGGVPQDGRDVTRREVRGALGIVKLLVIGPTLWIDMMPIAFCYMLLLRNFFIVGQNISDTAAYCTVHRSATHTSPLMRGGLLPISNYL